MKRRCQYCGGASTHVVKWPRRSILDIEGNEILAVVRCYVCVAHYRQVLTYQNSIGNRRVRGYRYRR